MEIVNQKQSGELFEAEAHIWNHIFSFINSMSLKCATELAIPDIIHKHGRPITLVELVDAIPGVDRSKADSVYRLMDILVHSNFFKVEKIPSSNTDEEYYSLTPASHLLVEDHPFSMKPYVISQLDPFTIDAMQHFSRWFKSANDLTPFHMANGMSFWEKKQQDPAFSRLFDKSMATQTPMVANVIIRDCRPVFEGLGTLVDVGGGTGTLCKAIANSFPEIQCSVLDLPIVVAGLEGTKNMKYVEGDMFKYVPPADAVLLKWILHDWNDEESVQILKNCKAAITSNGKKGKVILIETVVADRDDHKAVETQLFFDMLLMTVVTGRERKEKDWAKVFSDAGFSDYKIYPVIGLRSVIEVFP
ncbi:hypothetical protein BUALT_Bualt14G0006200 [Buddleja alternifolia]|uniref:O-methyltransferase n=1 Tax=Buddleja alternifolia TaxID=168488 RepID=A0AAV6WQZ7_9LAMI|nr:hypothetical protein BUALT_Bualt14G0006200 [Buddleja alternifolia]